MNGWHRIGIAITALWIALVAGYAGYERSLLPVRFFGEETQISSDGFFIARNLLFIDLDSNSRDMEGWLVSTNRAIKASSDEERNIAIAQSKEAGAPIFKTSLKDSFWFYLLVPSMALWAVSYIFVFVVRWIRAGFRPKQK